MGNTDASIKLNGVTKTIKEVGFPIVAFLMMFWLVVCQTKTVDANTKAIHKMTETMTAMFQQQNNFQTRVDSDHLDTKNDLGLLKERTCPH